MCSAELNEDFGLVDCPQCGSPVLISMDGSVEMASESASVAEPISEPIPEAPPEMDLDFAEDPFQYHEIETPEIQESPATMTPEEQAQEMSSIANDENIKAGDTALNYTIVIKGIDTSEIRRGIMDTISDLKFRIDADAVFAGMKNGAIVIENVSSIKAALIVQRLRTYPVEIHWQQQGRA